MATGRLIATGILPHEYRYQANLDSPVGLDAGAKYWLEVVQIGDITTHFRWEDSVSDLDGVAGINSIHNYWLSTLPGGPADAAYQLISPEPASLAMLALGLFYFAPRHRSRRETNGWM